MVLCPRLTDLSPSPIWPETHLFAGALELPLEWAAGSRELFRGGHVRVGWDQYGLRVHATLQDDNVFTRASADNQHMWKLGDVFELFLKLGDHDDYFELHTVPSGHRLQLHLPNCSVIEEIRDGHSTLESVMVSEPLFEFLTRTTESGWEVLAMVPHSTLDSGLTSLEGKLLFVSFGRYDYADENSEPVLSSTTRHEVLNFHRVHEWTPLQLKDGI